MHLRYTIEDPTHVRQFHSKVPSGFQQERLSWDYSPVPREGGLGERGGGQVKSKAEKKGKIRRLQWRNLADTILAKW